MPLRSLAPRSSKLEQIAEQPARALGDDDHVRLGDRLQPRREIGRIADDAALLRLSRAGQIADDDQPGRDAHAAPVEASRPRSQARHRLDER